MPEEFPRLFSPVSVGPVHLRNRIVMLPMETLFSADGGPAPQDVAFYVERARAGVGLVITGGTVAHPTSLVRGRHMLRAYDLETFSAFESLVSAVHTCGARIFGQLTHRGRDMLAGEADLPSWGASASPSTRQPVVPHEMTLDEITELVASFAGSAANLAAAGYDGIEIHAAHGYLLAQFLNAFTNRRQDEYGGSDEGRRRLLLEVVSAVRTTCGPGLAVGVRLSASEDVPGGLTLADSVSAVRALEESGQVDYVSLTIGARGSYVRDMTEPEGLAAPLAAEVKRHTRLPVLVGQRITSPALAETVLAERKADLIGLARALIADPIWAQKAQEGRATQIRPCVACLQDCRARTTGVGCVHNPAAGRELEWGLGTLVAGPSSRRVVVAGAGPAGLEAALTAALRGHRVLVLEQAAAPGGQVGLAASAPGRAALWGVVSHRLGELQRLGVEVRCGLDATPEAVLAEQPAAVVIAVGGVPLPVAASEGGRCLTTWDLLAGGDALAGGARTALVLDDGACGWETCGAAELLAVRGIQIELVTPGPYVGAGVPSESLVPLLRRLKATNAGLRCFTRALEIRPDGVLLEDALSGDSNLVSADLVAVNAGRRANHEPGAQLANALKAAGVPFWWAGDCLAARGIGDAVREGHAAGRSI